MTRYDVYESGFNNLDETINFGKRTTAGDKSLYEICTLAVIRSSETTASSEKLKITSHYVVDGNICIGINNDLRIIKSLGEPDPVASFQFENRLDKIVVSPCGRYLLVCVQNGGIYIRDISAVNRQNSIVNGSETSENEEFPLLFHEQIDGAYVEDGENYFLGAFVEGSTDLLTFYVVTCKGLVKKINLTVSESSSETFSSQIVIDLKHDTKICALAFPFLCLEGYQLFILNVTNNDYDLDDAIGLQFLHAIGNNFIAFDKNGNIFKIDSARCLIFPLNDQLPNTVNLFKNILIIADGEKRLVAGVTRDEHKIQLMHLLDPNPIYDIPLLESDIHLINTKGATEEILFLTEVRKDNKLREMRLQFVTETDPELRVKKLIQKGLIDKAEVFARNFNVNPQFVAEAKANHIVDKRRCTTEEIDELLNILAIVGDYSFRMQCCDLVVCETAKDTRRMICHGAFMDIGIRDSSTNDDNELLFMKRKFNRKLRRFDLYIQVYREYEEIKWIYFAECDLIEEVKSCLRQERMKEAALIYSRLENDEIQALTNEKIEEVMLLLKKFATYNEFLNTFIPLTLKQKPVASMIFVEWIHGQVYHMERDTEVEFPEDAIKLLEDVTALMNTYIPAQSQIGHDCREILSHLLKALRNIEMLGNNFFIRLPLSEYLSVPQNLVRTLLNIELEPTQLELLMKEFLYPFMLKCGVDTDALLLEEIKGLFIYEADCWLNVVHVLLKFVCKFENKLEIIKDILEIAAKPWNDKVKEIARITFEYSSTSPIAKEISELLRDEHIFIILQKYNINRNQFMSNSEKLFYFRRIIYLNKDNCDQSIEDIHQLCRKDEDRLEADSLMIREFIRRGYPHKALSFLDTVSPKHITALLKELLQEFLFMSECELLPMKYFQAFHGVLPALWNRISRYSADETPEIIHIYKAVNVVYGMKIYFGINVTPSVLNGKEKYTLLWTLFGKMTENEASNFTDFISSCKKIAYCLGDTLESILIEYMKFEENLNIFLNIGKYLLETSQCSDHLTLCATYLFKYRKNCIDDVGDETFLDVVVAAETHNQNNADQDLEAVSLAKKLCIKSLMLADPVDQMAILEVLRWINACYYLMYTREDAHCDADVHQIYLPLTTPDYFGRALEVIKEVFNMFCSMAVPLKNDHLIYLTRLKLNKVITRELFQQELDILISNMAVLLKQEQYMTVFNILKVVQESALFHRELQGEMQRLQTFISTTLLPGAVEAVISHNYIDKRLLLNLMRMFGDGWKDHLSKYLTVYKKKPKKLIIISQVGLNLLSCYQEDHGKKELSNILNLCKWWQRIPDPNIKYEAYFTSQPDARLETLVSEGIVKLESLPEYCTDFELDLQQYYLKYLKTILLNWQPDVEYITEVSGKKGIIIKNSETELASKCSGVVECITNKSDVVKLVEDIWPLINVYYYEVYLAILFVHMKVCHTSGGTISPAYRPLLFFLKTYKRISSPTRSEIEQWYGNFPFKALIDPLSEFRLPLTSTFLSSDIWNIIKPEVNLDTYKEWFKLTTILKQYLNQQDICTYAINNTLSSGLFDTSSHHWEVSLKYDHLLPKVDKCARHITDLERAVATVYTLMCGMPPGADKVQMAELSYKYAKLYREANTSDDVEKVYVKVKQRYLNYSAIHILHKCHLAEEKYLKQVAQPTELIWELYNDPRIENYFDNLIFDRPDINRAVEELCELFGLNVKRESFTVLTRLMQTSSPLDLDCSRLRPGNESIHLKRMCYLCEGQNVANWQRILFEQGTKNSAENDMSYRANALRCFFYISDNESIEDISLMSYEQFSIYLDKISVMAKMCDLGLKFETVEELDTQNQKRILKNLAKMNRPSAVKCIASLCKIYSMDDLKYWEYIVKSAVQFHMIRELTDYLEFLKDRCMTEDIKAAWTVVLADSFKDLTDPSLSASNIVLLLQTCPVIYEIDLEPHIQKCLLSKRTDLADYLRQFRIT